MSTLHEFVIDANNRLYFDGLRWSVNSKNTKVDLLEPADFYRVLILLEHDFEDAKRLVSDNGTTSFPMWKVAWAGIACRSSEWVKRAIEWLPNLSETDLLKFEALLIETQTAKWADQKTRQKAKLYLSRIKSTDK
jgi:hypothetical protein